MNDFEERLRVLLNEQVDARVDQHRPAPGFSGAARARAGERRPRPARMLPLLAAACIVVIGGGALGATHLLSSPEPRRHTVASNPTGDAAPGSAAATRVAPSPTASRSVKVRAVPAATTTTHRSRAATHRVGNPAPGPQTSAQPAAAPTSSASSSTPPPAPCDGTDLVVTDPHAITTPTDGSAYVIFQNTATAACTLQGTPNVVLVDAAGADGGTATPSGNVTDRSPSGPAPVVTLEPNGFAAAGIHWSSPDNGAPAGSCPDFQQLRVTAPDTVTSGTATASEVMHVCPANDGSTSLTVDAIVTGYPW